MKYPSGTPFYVPDGINWTSLSGYTSGYVLTATNSGGANWQAPGSGSGISTINCVSTYGSDGSICSGSAVATTGSITSGTNTLVVASANGWSVGMGIDVTTAGTASADLITYVTAISDTTLTLNTNAGTTATNVAVNHDDTRALTTAINSGKNVNLGLYQYNITSVIAQTCSTNSTPLQGVFIVGSGNVDNFTYSNPHQGVTGGSVVWNRGTTNNVFTICNSYTQLRDFSIQQAAGITPTAGYGIIFSAGGTGLTLYDMRINNIYIKGLYNGISMSGNITTTQINNSRIFTRNIGMLQAQTGSFGIQVNNTSFNPVTPGTGVGIEITGSDESAFISDTSSGWLNDFIINDSVAGVSGLRIIGGSYENSTATIAPFGAISISSTNHHSVHDITIMGCEFAQNTSYGIRVSNFGTNITISGNTFDGGSGGNGVSVASSDGQFSITNNNFENNTTAINIGTASSIKNVFMSGNTFYNNTTNVQNITGYTTGINSIDPNANGNIGIGTTNPPNLLYVNGTTAIMGNLGIGSTLPGQALDVQGTVRGLGGFFNNTWPGEETFSTASSITPTGNFKFVYMANSQGAATFTVNNPTNAGVYDGQPLVLKISSTAVQTFAWGNSFVGGSLGLPGATLGTSTIQYFCFLWDAVNSKWDYTGNVGGF